jgi:hypothetical protein
LTSGAFLAGIPKPAQLIKSFQQIDASAPFLTALLKLSSSLVALRSPESSEARAGTSEIITSNGTFKNSQEALNLGVGLGTHCLSVPN